MIKYNRNGSKFETELHLKGFTDEKQITCIIKYKGFILLHNSMQTVLYAVLILSSTLMYCTKNAACINKLGDN